MVSAREFHVLGQKIVVKTQEEADLATHALEIVGKKVEDLKARASHLSPHQMAVLALLEVAGDLVKDRKVMDEYRHELDLKCSYLMTEFGKAEQPSSKAKKHKSHKAL